MSGILAQNSGRHTGLVKASSGGGGVWTLIKTLTASSSATLSFVDGASDVVFDSTYDEYVFNFINIHPATDQASFGFNGSDDDSSHSYDVTKTTSYFYEYNPEGGGAAAQAYGSGEDLAEASGFQQLTSGVGSDNDQCCSGHLQLFNPSSTTFVKHFMSRTSTTEGTDYLRTDTCAGYFNTTADITAIQFKMSSGNIDTGSISLYGIS